MRWFHHTHTFKRLKLLVATALSSGQLLQLQLCCIPVIPVVFPPNYIKTLTREIKSKMPFVIFFKVFFSEIESESAMVADRGKCTVKVNTLKSAKHFRHRSDA